MVTEQRQVRVVQPLIDPIQTSRYSQCWTKSVGQRTERNLLVCEQIPERGKFLCDILEACEYACPAFSPAHVVADCPEYDPGVSVGGDGIANRWVVIVAVGADLVDRVLDRLGGDQHTF